MGDNIEIGKDGTFNGPVNVHHGPVSPPQPPLSRPWTAT
jgi:hypothetical protein